MTINTKRQLIEEKLRESNNFIRVIDPEHKGMFYTSKVYALTAVSGAVFGVVLTDDNDCVFKVCSLVYEDDDIYGTDPIDTKLMSNFKFRVIEQPNINEPTWNYLNISGASNYAILKCKTFLHVKEEQLDDMLNAFVLQVSRKHHMEIKNVNIVQGVVLGDVAKHNTTSKPMFNKLTTAEYTVVLWYEISPKF